MLAPPDRYRCLECTRVYGCADFAYHHGRIEDGAAYWSDRGLLCSAECAVKHYRHRAAEGSLPDQPADDPLQTDRTTRG